MSVTAPLRAHHLRHAGCGCGRRCKCSDVAGAVAVVSDFTGQLVGVIVAEGGHGSVAVRAGEDVAGIIVGVPGVGENSALLSLCQTSGCSIRIVVSERADAAVAVGLR